LIQRVAVARQHAVYPLPGLADSVGGVLLHRHRVGGPLLVEKDQHILQLLDPGTLLAFSSNGRDGTLTVVHEDAGDKYSVVENVATKKSARTMALAVNWMSVKVRMIAMRPGMMTASRNLPHVGASLPA